MVDPLTASDQDAFDTVTFSIGTTDATTGGEHRDLFYIDSGILRFKAAPDFEKGAGTGAGMNNYEVIVTASDGTVSDSQTITVTVTDVNDPPVFSSGATSSAAENTVDVVNPLAASDEDGDTVTFSIDTTDATTGGEHRDLFEIDSGILRFKAAPDFENGAGTGAGMNNYEVIVTASDSTVSVTQTITVTVTDVNEPPLADAGPDGEVVQLTDVTLDGSGSSDPEGQPLIYAWTQTGGAAVTLTGADTAALSLSAPTVPDAPDPLEFSLTVNDGTLDSAADTVLLTVGYDYDDDDDNLIDVRSLEQLDAIRYDLDGNGDVDPGDEAAYTAAFPNAVTGMGCPATCAGYELRRDLDFDDEDSYASAAVTGDIGVGGLAGYLGTVILKDSYATGPVNGGTRVGGLVGLAPGTIVNSYATGPVTGEGNNVGGLVGFHLGEIFTGAYYDAGTTGLGPEKGSGHGIEFTIGSKTTAELQLPTDYPGIYSDWDVLEVDADNADGNFDPFTGITREERFWEWDFGDGSAATWQRFGYQLREGPGNLAVTPGVGRATLSWTAVDVSHWDPAPAVTYAVYRDGARRGVTSGLRYTDTGVPGGSHAYHVAAVVNHGEGSRSAHVRVTVQGGAPSTGSLPGRSSGGGGRVVPANKAPSFREGIDAERSVPENAAAGTRIGQPLTASDADGNSLRYYLAGADVDFFAIDRSSGQLSSRVELDYEARTAYTVVVGVSDGNDGTDFIVVTVKVTDVRLGLYDADSNEAIDRDEAIAAVADYFRGVIGKEEAVLVIAAYFAG